MAVDSGFENSWPCAFVPDRVRGSSSILTHVSCRSGSGRMCQLTRIKIGAKTDQSLNTAIARYLRSVGHLLPSLNLALRRLQLIAGQSHFVHVLGTNKNGFHILLIRKPDIWCGEGDLNPHALSSASTSS
jgi:hypothetical protein